MNILVRYLFNNLLKPLIYLLLTFSLLFIIADLMDNGERFLRAKTSMAIIAQYYSYQLPSLLIFIVPICLLLATLYSLSMLTRHSEITAMRASGISIYRIIRPYLLMGFICFLLTALVNEIWGPRYAYQAAQLLNSQRKQTDDVYFEQIPFKNPSAGHSWYIESFDTRNFTMLGITLRKLREDGSDELKITARKGMWMDNRWWFQDGAIQRFDEQNNLAGPAETFQIREMRTLPEVPNDFMVEAKDTAHQSSHELWRYMNKNRSILSHKTLILKKVDLHHKLTMPFICLISVIIGIPVGTHTGRKGAFAGIMMAIAMFFGFYALQFFLEYLAKQMYFAPWIGAWASVIVFSILGLTLIHRMR